MTDRYDNLAKRMECTPEEIPALIQQHAPWNGRDMCNDSIALAAEVVRLRSINDEYLLNMGRQHAKLREQAHDAAKERAAVVAWLRDVKRTYNHGSRLITSVLCQHADAIERGAHCDRREED